MNIFLTITLTKNDLAELVKGNFIEVINNHNGNHIKILPPKEK